MARKAPSRAGFSLLGLPNGAKIRFADLQAKETPGPKPGALGRLLARPWDGLVGFIQISAGLTG